MDAGARNVLGLVELQADFEATNIHNSTALNIMRDAFQDRLKDWVRAKDQWRLLNGNRVCVILKDIEGDGQLELAAAKLERIFREPHLHLGKSLPLSVRAGFAKFGGNDKDMSLAMQQAGQALNQAKQLARPFKVFSPESISSIEAERKLLGELEAAFENSEFVLYYQPKVHAGYKNLIGAEALVRWHRNDGEIVLPDEFIGLVEQHELIKPFTLWSIKSAIARLARWPDALSIAVNVSPALLLEDDILSVVQDALDIYSVSARRLNLEVTEKIMVDNQVIMLSQLARLRDIGVRISLDDFGTGFSSLAYFRDLPVDEIKIDQGFVRRMLKSEKDYAIVKAVIDLAHNFSMKVVAEGVESLALADELSKLRCDILQGYVFDRPLPPEIFERNYRL